LGCPFIRTGRGNGQACSGLRRDSQRRDLATRWLCVIKRLPCVRSRRDSASNLQVNTPARPETHQSGRRRCANSISRRERGFADLCLTHRTELLMPTTQPPPRLFLCARCRSAVTICSYCDRGQRYCSADCSLLSRTLAQRAASKRYQDSRKGRHAHAQRQAQWRARLRSVKQIVTHQGSPPPPRSDVLPPDQATSPHSCAKQSCTCHFCGRSVSVFLRQGFLGYRFRHATQQTVRSTELHDYCP